MYITVLNLKHHIPLGLVPSYSDYLVGITVNKRYSMAMKLEKSRRCGGYFSLSVESGIGSLNSKLVRRELIWFGSDSVTSGQ